MLALLVAKSLLAGLTVSVPAGGFVRGTEMELGELCAVTGSDPDLVQRARALSLGIAPAPGFARLLTRERIEKELALAFPGLLVRVQGERMCRAEVEVEELTSQALEGAARRELERAFEGIPASFTLSAPLAPLRIPRGNEPTTLRAVLTSDERRSGSFGVAVEIVVDGQRYRTAWTSWRVDVWEVRPALGPLVRPSLFFAALGLRPRARDERTGG